ncbi:RecA-like recombination protein [Klebsiella phage CPRSB]|nr:RecA-like recombination protein [Klebsiella phage CPRSB]
MKEGTEVVGYDFIMNIEKSRFVKEKSKFPLHVTYEGGISMYSGLLDLAMEMNFVQP